MDQDCSMPCFEHLLNKKAVNLTPSGTRLTAKQLHFLKEREMPNAACRSYILIFMG